MISGTSDLAELAVRVNYADVDKAAQSLDRLKASSAGAEQATSKVGVSSVAATRSMGAWSAIQAEAEGKVGEHSLAIGRLGYRLESLTTSAVGANSAMGLLGASFLKFGVGDVYSIAILGGIYAIVEAYDFLTAGSNKAREEADKMTKSLVDQARAARALTVAGAENIALIASMNLQSVKRESGMGLGSILMSALTGRLTITGGDADAQAGRVANAQTAVDQANGDVAKAREKIEGPMRRKREEEERKAAEAALEASKKYWGKQHEEWERAREIVGKLNEDTARYARENPASKVANETVLASLGIKNNELSTSMPHVSLNDGLSHLQEVLAKLIKDLADVAENARIDIATQRAHGQLGIATFKENWKPGNIGAGAGAGATDAIGSALMSFSPSGLAYQAVSAGINYIANGLVQTGLDMLGMGQSMTAMRLELRKQREEYEASVAAYTHDDLAAQLAQNLAAADALRQSAKATLLTVENIVQNSAKAGLDYAAALQAISDAQAKNAEMIKRQQVYAQEDLTVRNLRATGHTDQADLLAFQEAQAREMQKAIDDNRDALYLNSLATTQNNELIAFQNGLLADAVRNSPTGFFASAYYSQFATPRGGDPFGTGMPPLNQPGPGGAAIGSGLTPPGNRGGNTTIQLVLQDGRVLGSVVVKAIDQVAAATAGAGSSRAAALEKYPI